MKKIKLDPPNDVPVFDEFDLIDIDDETKKHLERLFESSLNDQTDKEVKCIPLYIQEYVSNDKILTVGTPTSRYSICNKKTLDSLIKLHGDRFSQLYKVIEIEGEKI